MRIRTILKTAAFTLLLVLAISSAAAAEEGNKYYLNDLIGIQGPYETGLDTGFSGKNLIKGGDPHFGHGIGRFYVTGFTSTVVDNDGTVVFLKNVGDKITLHFELKSNIDLLFGNENLKINEDINGYDNEFGIDKSDFGRGALFIRHRDYQNADGTVVPYINFLSACNRSAAKTINPYEEGDYEGALDYEVIERYGLFNALSNCRNYRISFKFKVRNSNCMVFLRDAKTQSELANGSVAVDGFSLDFANSHYLDVTVKHQIIVRTSRGYSLDIRGNKAASDRTVYQNEGIYTITVKNRYTQGDPTVKIIAVGTNELLNAYVASECTIDLNTIAEWKEQGATIDPVNWLISMPLGMENQVVRGAQKPTGDPSLIITVKNFLNHYDTKFLVAAGAALVLLIVLVVVICKSHAKKKKSAN